MDSTEASSLEPDCKQCDKFPPNTRPFENQVAGHSFNDGHCNLGILKDDEGFILKPVNKPINGQREILFYEKINNSTEGTLLQLKLFVPEFYGSVTLKYNGMSTQFLKLSDATRGYSKPCIMDIKVGQQTWEPGASLEKQQSEQAKYIPSKQQCGFCIPGFQVYNVSKGTIEKYGKDYGRKLTKEHIPGVLKKFLNCETGKSNTVGEEMLRQLKVILDWWRSQRLYHFYSSSVLLTYDADLLDTVTVQSVKVLLIDFAHVVPANNTLDTNYLLGLENLVKMFTSIVTES